MEFISFACSSCKKTLKVSAEKAGRKIKCGKCGAEQMVRAEKKAAPAAPPVDDDKKGYGLAVDPKEEEERKKREAEEAKKKKKEKKAKDKPPPIKRKYKTLQDLDQWKKVRHGLMIIMFGGFVWAMAVACHFIFLILSSIAGPQYAAVVEKALDVKYEPINQDVDLAKVDPPKAFVPLFNQVNTQGWQASPKAPGSWVVKNGMLVGQGPQTGPLFTVRNDFGDIEIDCKLRVNKGGAAGIMLRQAYDPDPNKGYLVKADASTDPGKAGVLYVSVMPPDVKIGGADFQPTDLVELRIRLLQNRIRVSHKGAVIAEYTDPGNIFSTGHIGLYRETPATVLEVIDLSYRDAVEDPPAPPGDNTKPTVRAVLMSKRPFMIGLVTGDNGYTMGLILLGATAIFLMLQSIVWIAGYCLCLPIPNRYGTKLQVMSLLGVSVTNAVCNLVFKMLPIFGAIGIFITPWVLPETAMLTVASDRSTALWIYWSTWPFGEILLSVLFMALFYAEPMLIGIFCWSIGTTLKEDKLIEAGQGVTQLALGVAFTMLGFYLMSLAGSSSVLLWVLRLIFLLMLIFTGYLLVRVPQTAYIGMKLLDKYIEAGEAVGTAKKKKAKDDDEDDDDEDDEDEDKPRQAKGKRRGDDDDEEDDERPRRQKSRARDDDDDDEDEDDVEEGEEEEDDEDEDEDEDEEDEEEEEDERPRKRKR